MYLKLDEKSSAYRSGAATSPGAVLRPTVAVEPRQTIMSKRRDSSIGTATGSERVNRRNVLKAAAGGMAGVGLMSGAATAGSNTLEVRVFATEQLYDSEGRDPQYVARDYLRQAIGDSPITENYDYDVQLGWARMDLQAAVSDGTGAHHAIREFLCCGEHATAYDPTDEVAKDSNVLLTNKRDLDDDGDNDGGSTRGRSTYIWVGDRMSPVYGQDPQTLVEIEKDSNVDMADRWYTRVWKILHEAGHTYPKYWNDACDHSHETGNRYKDSDPNLYESPMGYRTMKDRDCNCCNQNLPPTWSDGNYDTHYHVFQYLRCTCQNKDTSDSCPSDHNGGTPRIQPQSYAAACNEETLCGKWYTDDCSNRVCDKA